MEFLNYKGLEQYHELLMNHLLQIDPSGAYLPLIGGEMQGHIDMLDSSIIWDDWNSSIGEMSGQLVITGGEGIIFNGPSYFTNGILPNSTGVYIGDLEHFFYNAYIENIITDQGIFYNDLIDDGRSIITVNESNVLRVTVDEGGNRTFTLGAGNNNDCFVVKSDYFDINCAAGGTNIYGFLSISDSAESSAYGQLSINEGRLEILSETGIHLNGPVSIPADYSIAWEDSEGTAYSLGVGKTPVGEYPVLHTEGCYIETLYADAVGTPSEPTLAVHTGIINLLSEVKGTRPLLTANRVNILGQYLNPETETYEYYLNIEQISSRSQSMTVESDSCYFTGEIKSDMAIEATDGFKKTGSTNDYVLLAGGGTAPLSSIQGSGGTVTSITPGTGLTGASNNDSAITTSGTINLKKAETSEIGGIKVKAVKTSAIKTAIEGTNYYPVNIDSNGLGYVALPAFKTSDNNTTYTFSGGTNGFTVTPSGGTAQTVTVTPSITNNITGSGTSGCLAKFNGTNTLTSGPKLGSDKTKFLRNDGEWAVPPGTGVTGDYLPLAGGDMSGSICMNSNPITFDQDAFCQIYEDSGQIHIESDEGIVLSNQVTIGSEAQILSSQDDSVLTISCEGITLQAGDEVKLATGSVTSTGSVHAPSFFETSDIRKKNIKSDLPLDKCYELIDKCQTVIYSLKDQTQEQIGMIAQEVEQFFPELVDTDKEGFKSLAYDRLVIICFKVLKDIIKRLEKLGV